MNNERIIPIYIEEEMKDSFLDYAMSVIMSRALPDVRDGLKPVHRRILYAMKELGVTSGKSYRKCARIVGETMGKYHPHGDMSIYGTLVRLAQDFSMRYPLIDGQGNYGSVDGDAAAAMRYTEARMSKIASLLLEDINKDTVDFKANFDDTLQEPILLPSALPNLLVNGSSGIAVGMASNIPPHNLNEIVDALIALIDEPEMELKDLLGYIKGPDFPTGAIIFGRQGIYDMYTTGRGRIILRGKANVETYRNGREAIIITEIPYYVNKAKLITNIAKLVHEKKVEGIADLRDESDRDGMRIVLDLKRNSYPDVILNTLYKHTQLQNTFGAIMLALVNGAPKVMNIKEILRHFIDHRHTIVIRRTEYDLKKAEARAHILEGLRIALDHIDEIIKLIRASKNVPEASSALMTNFNLSEIQAQAILDMRLQKLTGLERDKIEYEYKNIIQLIERLRSILANLALRMKIIKDELLELKGKYGDERRTDIIDSVDDFSIEDLIAEEDMIVTISHTGYIKRLPIGTYRRQRRGGQGVTGMNTKSEDFVEHLFVASTHSYLLFFSDKGKCYWLKVHQIPQGGRLARGKAIINLLKIEHGEKVSAILQVKEFDAERYITFITKKGLIKKTVLSAYSHPRTGGIIGINLNEGDSLIDVLLTDGTMDLIIATRYGQAIRFSESQVRSMGRNTAGVHAIKLKKHIDARTETEELDEVVGIVPVIHEDSSLLVVTEGGFGKRTSMSDYRTFKNRGGSGVITIKTNRRNGKVVAIKSVTDEHELMIITANGVVIRLPLTHVRVIGRNTSGVKLINLKFEDRVVDVARLIKEE